ncbi:MAG TPA: ComF family protein [Burkholderiales bacterium]|nr:ComF family protein [Burkholderiales bacterium]
MRARLASLMFGGSCFLCRGGASELLCPSCEADLPRLAPGRCPRCALPSPSGEACGRCIAQPPHYDATVAALAYAFPADALVHALKFRGELSLAALLAGFLSASVNSGADFVVPVPLSRERLRQRGYNQALEIARHLGRGRPLAATCERRRDTAPQIGLPHDERRRNVKGCFTATRAFDHAVVAVVDDVMTTGATLDEMARTLKAAGASRVVNWVVARTLLDA